MTVWERGIWEGFGCARKGRRWRGALMGFNGEGGRHLAGKEIGDERERDDMWVRPRNSNTFKNQNFIQIRFDPKRNFPSSKSLDKNTGRYGLKRRTTFVIANFSDSNSNLN
jgi:hypothetical protein